MPIQLNRDQFRWTNGRGHNQKPILYAQKTNTRGLGKNEHNFNDQWWTKAFDAQLKGLDVNNSATGEVSVKTANITPLGMTLKARYYIRFIPGGLLHGGVEKSLPPKPQEKVEKVEKVKKVETKEERRTRRAAEKEGKEKRRERKKERMERKVARGERREKKRLKRLVEKEMKALK